MATVQMTFDLVPLRTFPTDFTMVLKVDSVLDCANECMRQSTCEAMVFSTLYLVCCIYQGDIPADQGAYADVGFLAYNFMRATGCSGNNESVPGPSYRVCPLGREYRYEPSLNVCYKRLHSTNLSGKDVCVQNGASDLLTIDNQEKQGFFKNLIGREQYTYIRGDRIPATGEWAYWEEGTTRPMPFTDWADGQPNGATSGQDCMALDSTGQHDASCKKWHYFFCEYYL